MTKPPRFEQENTAIAQRVVARYLIGMEHATDEARKKYLKDHPNADPSNHTVKKKDPKKNPPDRPQEREQDRDYDDEEARKERAYERAEEEAGKEDYFRKHPNL